MQGILGASLNKPLFYVKRDEEEKKITIFFGFKKLTTIPDDKNSLLFRSTIAMLVNAGVCKKHIQENFNVAFETVQKSVEIFNTAETDEDLLKEFKWPGRAPKVNEELFNYIHERASFHKSNGEYHYIKKTISDIKEKYNINISREKIRLELQKKKINSVQTPRNNSGQSLLVDTTTSNISVPMEAVILPPQKSPDIIFRNQYAGLLLLSYQISLLFGDFPEIKIKNVSYMLKAIFTWWILGILSSAKNLEQHRYFNVEDFEIISGYKNLPSVENMRNILYDLSMLDDTTASTIILKKNIDYFIEEDYTYYLDPHFEEYTGSANITKGWNTIKNRVSRGNFDNFVHDGAGNPIFTVLMDTFYDFREIIIIILSKIKTLRPNKPITLVYDRGGFSTELMNFIGEGKEQYFITWQKGFEQKEAQGIDFNNEMSLEYPYNDVGKFKVIKYHYSEDIWECKDVVCRRIIIKKGDNSFYQSILTNNTVLDGVIIIKKMLARTLQENDFKKQKSHFGLDEITSYRKNHYVDLNDKDPDKKIKNPEYEKILKNIQEFKIEKNIYIKKIGTEMYAAFLKNDVPLDFLKMNKEVFDKIEIINIKIEQFNKEKKKIPKHISKFEFNKSENKVEIDLRAKRLMGLLKITVRNMLENGAKDFLETYKNLRDYQKVFRKLIRMGGEITLKGNIMHVKLDSFGRTSFKELCNNYFEKINSRKLKDITGTYFLEFALFD